MNESNYYENEKVSKEKSQDLSSKVNENEDKSEKLNLTGEVRF